MSAPPPVSMYCNGAFLFKLEVPASNLKVRKHGGTSLKGLKPFIKGLFSLGAIKSGLNTGG